MPREKDQMNNIQVRTWVAEKLPEKGGLPLGWYFFMQSDSMKTPTAYGPYKTIEGALDVQRRFLGIINAPGYAQSLLSRE
jgi:hypothetical protein